MHFFKTNTKKWLSLCKAKLKQQQGWLLMDSLIAIIIILVALTAILGLYTQTSSNNTANRNYNTAVYLAQDCLENLKKYEKTSTIANLPTGDTHPPDVSKNGVTYTIVISPVTPADNLDGTMYPYQATVSWTEKSGNRQISLVSYYYSE